MSAINTLPTCTRLFMIRSDGRFLSMIRAYKPARGLILPGGTTEENEDPADGLIREILEELGVTITEKIELLGSPIVSTAHRGTGDVQYHFYRTNITRPYIVRIMEPKKFDGYLWTYPYEYVSVCRSLGIAAGDGIIDALKYLQCP